ncbi:T9SS C-terminal target domain-containing protein [Flammeovirga sp. OC4]|uniref:T9SS C-terminal target domain-containing protein n=1 Tax=Flammeovirga sp. OC4 TaxID=1382345 RepID=UPI0005C66D18|nr:T9SS C-terminal target domain-containing protein [Flammeovirga sp. OC4]
MNKSVLKTLLFLIICTLSLLVNKLHAQTIIREFNGTTYTDPNVVINGCGGVAIDFSVSPLPDHSYSNYQWSRIENGIIQPSFSMLADPFEQFNTTGVYGISVTFDDYDSTNLSTTTRTLTTAANIIEVFDQPEGSFFADVQSVCVGGTITLTQTTPGTFSSLSFLVDNQLYALTGDSTTITLDNPGDYDVVLSGTTTDGCQFIRRMNDYLHVEKPYSTSFIASQTLSCNTTQNVTFTATSTDIDGGSVSPTYFWNFGDGTLDTTSINTVTHTFDRAFGTDFNVTVSTESNNCPGTINNSIDIYFRSISSLYGTPTVSGDCNDHILTYTPGAIDPQLAGMNVTWDFGDGSTPTVHAIGDIVSHAYSNPSPNPVNVTVSATLNNVADNSCSYTDAQVIPILPEGGITISSNELEYCNENFDVIVGANNLQNVTNFYWVLDGNTSTPIGNNAMVDTIAISGFGSHTIELFFDAGTGDLNDNCALNSIEVYSAPLSLSVAGASQACEPANDSFFGSSTWTDQDGNTVANPFPVNIEEWEVVNSINDDTTYYYTNPLDFVDLEYGSYRIRYNLTLDSIGNNAQCEYSSIEYLYEVGEVFDSPTLNLDNGTICIGTIVNFSTTTDADTAGLGLSGEYPIIYEYRYASNLNWVDVGTAGIGTYYYGDIIDDNRIALPGVFQVELRAVINGCAGEPTMMEITIEPSEAEHELTTDECNPTVLGFVNNSLGTNDTDYRWTLTITPPSQSSVTWTSGLTKDENFNFLAEPDFPTFTGYPQGEIPENSQVDVTIEAIEPGNSCSDTEDTTFFMPGPLPQLTASPQTSTGTCINDTLVFNAGDGNMGDNYLWTFTHTTDTTIQYTFSSNTSSVNTFFSIPGEYNGNVLVTTTGGCTFNDSVGPIQITGGSIAISGPSNGCVGDNFTFSGTNLMYSPNAPNYTWKVDGATQSSGIATGGIIPDLTGVTFASPNTPQSTSHTISLELEVDGCSAEYSHDIIVTQPDFDFPAPHSDYISFDYQCDEIITVVDLDLDDNEVYNLNTATITYSIGGTSLTPVSQTDDQARLAIAAGTYTMTVTIEDEFGCSSNDNLLFTVPTMRELEADLTPNTTNLVCPGFVSFADSLFETPGHTTRRQSLDSTNTLYDVEIMSWAWDFDADGTVDVTTTTGNVTHFYDRPGEYKAIVTVTDAQGCQDESDSVTIEVGGTAGGYEILKKIGFEPATTTMVAIPVMDPNTDISNTIYQWSSGHGLSGSDSVQVFTYNTTIGGANLSTVTPNLTFLDENGCSYPADYSGDMTILSCPDISNPDITLCTDNGPYTLNVEDMAWNSQFSQADTIETDQYIYSWELQYRWFVDGNPISEINGGHDTEVTFSFASVDTNPFVINPDDADGKLYTIQTTIIASYVDKIDASNNALNISECVTTDNIRVIFNPTPVAAFTNTEACGGDPTTLDASTTGFGLYSRGSISNYEWDIDNDGTYDISTASSSTNYTFPGQGVYPVTLRVTSSDGCVHQTTVDSVIVNSIPVGDYSYQNICQSFGIQLNDQSSISPVTDDEIVRWDWDFNNNGTFDIGGTDTLIHQFPLVSFDTLRDNYNTGAIIGTNVVLRPRLRVTTNKGCTFDYIPSTDSLLVFSFDDPIANLSAERQSDNLVNEVCLGQTMQFNDLSNVSNTNIASYISSGVLPNGVNDINAWMWDFGDGNFSTSQSPTHDYLTEGTYTVRLTVTTARGCSDSNTITVNVRENPDPEIGSDSLIVCDDQTVSLRPIANDSINFAYTWSQLISPTTGSITENNLNAHTATVDVDESDFNPGESIIDIRYQLEIIDNNHPTACTTFDTVDVQFHRFPNIVLDTTLVSCDTSAHYEALPFGTETINGFNYQWTQVYLSGGTVTETSLTAQDFTVKPNTYNSGSTIIRAKYYIDVTNAIGCTDRDSIEFEFYRRPDFSLLNHTSPVCNDTDRSLYVVDFYPFGTSEILPHNAAYDYTWSMSSSPGDHNVDPAFLNDLINQVTTNDTTQNLSLNILEDYFNDNTTDLSFEIDLHVENTFDNTCLKDTSLIINIERRPRDFTLLDTRVDPCNLSVTLNHHTETLDFNYRWRATSVSSEYNGPAIPDTNDQIRTLNFSDTDFATGESQFTVVMNNRVRRKTNPRCTVSKNVTLQFYRTPNINFSEIWPNGNNCARNLQLSSGSEVIPGFDYSWVQTAVSNGTVVHDATNNKDINLSVGSWDTGETVITVTYELTVTNSASPTCMDVESYTFEFHRTPEISYNPTALNCALLDTITVNSEALNSATFSWNENTVSGGVLTTTDNGNEYIIEVDSFDPTSHRIDGNYSVNIANTTASICDNDTTLDIVFFRTPEIAFTDTRTDSCALTNTYQPFGTTTISGYNYQWRELYVNGGTISTNSLTDQDLTFDVVSFDQDTAYIDIAYELYVENSDATSCIDVDTVMFQFYRTPQLNNFRKTKPNDECGLSVVLYPLDSVEVINHSEGFDYTWTLDASTVTGATSSTLPATVITDISNQVNTQNFSLNMPLTAFEAGSNEITFELDLNIVHSASGVDCSTDSTILLSFKRPPVIDMVEVKSDSCALSATLQPFGTETINGFNYDWQVVSITNYTNSTYAVGQNFTSQDLTVNLVDSDFTPTESKITMIVALEVQNQLLPTNPSCIDNITDTLVFYRTPEIDTPFLSTKINTCDHTATAAPFTTEVNGYGYVWEKVSETNGAVTDNTLTNREITVSLDTFATNSLQVDAQYRLRVFNIEVPSCYDEQTVDFEFYRTPEMAFDNPLSYCASVDSSMTFRSNNEAFVHFGADFYWNLNSITGGTIDSTAGGSEVFTIDVASFDTDAVRIDAEYTLTITNPSTHTCDDDTTFQVTFFRTPEINFASTKTDSCALTDIIQPFNGEDIPLFTRNWRQLSVNGGAITQNSSNTDLDLDITADSFDQNSTTITVRYELTATNSVSNICVDKDTVEFYFYRIPNFNNYNEQQPLGLCGGLIQVAPLGLTEVINHNNGFDYTWTLDPTSVSGAGVDGNTLSTSVLNYLNTNQNSQNLSVNIEDSDYQEGAHILRFNMDFNIRHSNTNITCADSSKTIMFQYYRNPEINITELKADSCDLTTTLQPFGAEIIPGFSHNWEIQNITGYNGSDYAVNDTYTTQNTTFTITDDDFISNESVISITLALTVVNTEAPLDNSCSNTETYTLYFYRTPQIKNDFFASKDAVCDNNGTISPFDTHINGYVYQWTLDSISTKNGVVTGVVNDNSSLAERELNVQVDSFTDLHSIMKVYYKLRVLNSSQPICYAEDTVTFTFYRTPEVMLTSMTGACQNAVKVTSTNEMLMDVDFDWMLISQSGGTVLTDPADHDGHRTITFTATDYDPGQSEINSTYMITLLNSGESMCDDDTTFNFTLYRHPEINFSYTRSSADSCADALTIHPFYGEGISGFTNSWSEISRTGGTITTSSLTDEDLTISLDTFEINSTRVDTRYSLTSFNTNSASCEDSMSIVTTLYRQADFTNFNESRAGGMCGLEMTLSPLGLIENIPHNTGFDYTWSYDSLNVTGAANNQLPPEVINSFYNQVNNQNLSLTLPIEAFANGSNKIEIPVTITIDNSDQNSCSNSYNHTMVFYRPPVFDIQQSLVGCDVTNTITTFGSENASSAFNYNWSFAAPTGGTVTNTSLTGQNITFSNPVFNNGSDTIRINVALTVENAENTSCQADTAFTFVFYKTPVISFSQTITGCDSVNLIRSMGTETINGFAYLWEQTQLSGGQVGFTPGYSTTTQDIEIEKVSFDAGSHKIDTEYKLTVHNTDTLGNVLCSDIDSTSFTILRVPSISIQQSLVAGDCGNTNTITTFGTEIISGFVYEWTPVSVNGGTVNLSSTTTQNVTFDNPIFDVSSNKIDITYSIVVRNAENPSTCFDTETVTFTFYRTPTASLQPITPVCSSTSILLTTQESYVPDFNYLWTLLDTRVDNNPNTETLIAPQVVQSENTYTINSPVDMEGFFPTGSSEITYEYEVSVENGQSPGCTDKDTIEATFYRVPILSSTQSLDSTNCELVNIIRPFGTESIPNYNYTWTEVAVNGGSINVTHLDPQNQDTQFSVVSFDSLSHRIDVSYSVFVTNNSGACTGNETYNFTFFRTPQASLSHLNLTPACMDSEVTLFPIDNENAGFTYQWTPISVTTDNGIDLLASNIKPLESNLNNHTLTLNHNPNFPQNAVRVTSVYELTVTNSDNGCTSSDQVTVIFDRDALLALSTNNFSTCDNNDITLQTVEPRTDNYAYTWTIDSIYTDNNADITAFTNVNTSTVGSMTIDGIPADFPSGSALITAKYNVHAENQLNTDCDADTSYTISIARQPMISFTDNHSGCALDSVTIKPLGDEIINGFNYNWTIVSIDGYSGNSSSILNAQNNNQNIDLYFGNNDFSAGRSQIEVTFELTANNPNEGGCSDTQQHTLVFFRVPMIDFSITKASNDSCASEIVIQPFNEVVSDYSYQWTLLTNTNGSVSMVNDQARDLVVNNPIFDQGETRIDLRYQLEIINNNVNASQPCITTEEVAVSFFKTPVLENDLLTTPINCGSNAKLKGLTFDINTNQDSNYVFDWSINNLTGGTIDTVSVLDSLLIDVNEFDQGSGEINFTIDLMAHNSHQYNTCFANETRSLTFYRTPQVSLNSSATDLCENNQFTITTGEEAVSEFNYNWSFNITDDIGNNTGTVDSTSNGSRGHALIVSNPTFPTGASYIEIEATLEVLNGNSGCSDTESITLRFHRQPELSIVSSNSNACDNNTIILTPLQSEVQNFTYTWERLRMSSDIDSVNGADIQISSMSDYQVIVENPTFPNGAAQLSAWYKLTVSNPSNPYCTIVSDSIEVTFFRSPISALGEDLQAGCDSSIMTINPINEEFIGNFNYNWTINRIDTDQRTSDTRASVTINNASTYQPTFEVTTIPGDASWVKAYISLTTENQLNNCGTSTDEIAVTFLRTPTVSLPADMADCQERVFFLSPNETNWSGMDYEWEVIESMGGSINNQSNMNSYLASLSEPVFNSNSFEVNSTIVLRVKNKENSNCVAIDTMNIVFNRTPIANFVVDQGFGCQNELIHFSTRNAEVPHAGSVFEWDFNNDGNYEIQTSGDTTYTFTKEGDHPVSMRIITPAGCISDKYTSIVPIHEIPTPSFTFNDICIGEVAQFINTTPQLNQSGDHGIRAVKWDFDYSEINGALFDAYETNTSFQYPEAGTFAVLVEVTNNGGCTNTYIDSITVTPLPVVTLPSDVWICEGLATTLTPEVDVPVTYLWSTGETTQAIEVAPQEETTYTLTVTNSQGCVNTHDITVHIIPDIDMDREQESCETEAITFDARIPDYEETVQTYIWSTGETTPTIDVLENGVYSVRTMVEHSSGTMCEFTHEFEAIFHPNPEMVLEDTTFCFEFGDLLQVGAIEGENFTYQWNTGETSRVVTRDRSGTYTVVVTDETHATRCSTVDTIFINQICPARMNTPNAFTPNGDGINDEFLLEPAYAVDIDLHIFNNWGESIFHKEYKTSSEASSPGNGWDGQYKGADMISGNYTYTIRYTSQKDGSVTEKTGQILLIR